MNATAYKIEDLVQSRNLIINHIQQLDEQLQHPKPDLGQVRRCMRAIEDRCIESRNILAAMRGE
jgi:hypothetical protein